VGEEIVSLAGVTVARGDGPPVLRDLSWAVRDGEAWAVVGPTASGKSTLLETLLGRHRLLAGEVRWPLIERLRAGGRRIDGPGDVCRLVSFQEDSRLFRYAGHYYQQRFEFADAEEPLSLADYLRAGSAATDDQLRAAADDLGIGDRLGQPFMTLSNGQTRRARIARALLADPEVLLLDDPFMGLDADGRGHLADLLGGLVRRGRRLVLVCRREAVPGWATGVLELGEASGGP
jgi:molybdate transport system ATP-binding protein